MWAHLPLFGTHINLGLSFACWRICKVFKNYAFRPGDLALWPMTLTFKVDLDGTQVHTHAKFHDPISNSSWDMVFGLVNFGLGLYAKSALKSCFFNHGDLTLWPMTLTFMDNLEGIQVDLHAEFHDPTSNSSWDMIFGLGFFLHRQTDRQNVTHMSPPFICTGGLNKNTDQSRLSAMSRLEKRTEWFFFSTQGNKKTQQLFWQRK